MANEKKYNKGTYFRRCFSYSPKIDGFGGAYGCQHVYHEKHQTEHADSFGGDGYGD